MRKTKNILLGKTSEGLLLRDEIDGKIEPAEFEFLRKISTPEDAGYWDWLAKEDIDIVNF